MGHSSRGQPRPRRAARALVVLLTAGLTGVLGTSGAASAAPADDPPGTVAGAASPAGAPVLTSGEYVDAIAVDRPRYYAVNLAAGVTPYLTATLVRPRGTFGPGIKDVLQVQLETAAGEKCGADDNDVDQSEQVVLLVVPIRLDPTGTTTRWKYPFDGETCGRPGKYVVRVTRVGQSQDPPVADDQRGRALPLELTFLAEPPADTAGLPAPAATLPSNSPKRFVPPAPDFTGNAREARGGTGYSDAPTLSPGLSGAEIASGETRYWKVPLEWGQRLSYAIRFERTPGLDSSAPVRTWVANRLRQYVKEFGSDASASYDADADPATVLRDHTVPVRYTNRRADPDDLYVRPVHLAGWYYVVVRMEPDARLPSVRTRIQLAVDVLGERSGVPAYRTVDGAAPLESLLAGSGTVLGLRPRTVALVAGGVAALLVAGALVVVPWLRPRRRR